jgi:two-component system, LuxR family, sensor kinase FixL
MSPNERIVDRSPTIQLLPGDPSMQHTLLVAGIIAVSYWIGVYVGIELTFEPNPVSTLWPPNAILLAGLLITPRARWWILIAAVFPVHLIAETLLGVPLSMALCWFISNTAEALIGAALIFKFTNAQPRFDRVRELSVFLVCGVLIAPVLSSFLDASFVALVRWRYTDYWLVWRMRLFSNALAALTLVPLIVIWYRQGLQRLRTANIADFVETAIIIVAICVTSFAVFERSYSPEVSASLMYAPLPILMWAAVRRDVTTVSLCVAIVAFLAIDGALKGFGPFAASTTQDAALAVQTFLIIAQSSLMLLAASLAEMRQTKSALKAKKESLDLALGAAQMGTWSWDVEADRVNYATVTASGNQPSDSVRLSDLLERIHPDDRNAVRDAIDKALATTDSSEVEYRFVRRDGGVRWIASRGKLLPDAHGSAQRMIGVFVDITPRKMQELQMRTQQEQLAYLSRISLMGELSGALAHELNQPLAAILLNGQAARCELDKSRPDLDEISQILDDIVSDDQRAGEVIRRLRTLFIKGAVEMKQVAINTCIREVLSLEYNHLVARRVTVNIDLTDELPLVMGDGVQLQQVLLNLIVNACEAMSLNEPRDRRLHVTSTHTDEGGVEISICDCGRGVEDVDAVFEPFFSTKEKGIGLGLAVSRTIIKAHHGRLWATRNTTRGTTFHIALPGEHAVTATGDSETKAKVPWINNAQRAG